MTRKALQLAATAYLTGDVQISNAALALAKRWPQDRRALTLSKGGVTIIDGVLFFNGHPLAFNNSGDAKVLRFSNV